MSDLVAVERLTRRFGGLTAVDQVTFDIGEGRIVGLIGPNGAGKSTLFSLIAGAIRPSAGRVRFSGRDVTGWRAHQAAVAGVGRTFQVMRGFNSMTVLENVAVGAHLRHRGRRAAQAAAHDVLRRTGLDDLAEVPVAALTAASRKRLEVARALATRPRLLLLDEVMAGLRPTECDQMIRVFRELNGEGLTILLIEHVMRAVMALAKHIGVLHHGEVIARGTPEEVVRNPAVLECYLGEETEV